MPVGGPSLVGTTHLRIPTITCPMVVCSILLCCFFRLNEEFNLAVFVKYDICGVLKGKHRHIFVFWCWFIWIHLLLLCLRPWKMNFRSPSFLTGVTYYHSPFCLCTQLTVYVKLVFHLQAFLSGIYKPPGEPFLEKWKANRLSMVTVRIQGREALCELCWLLLWVGGLDLWDLLNP